MKRKTTEEYLEVIYGLEKEKGSASNGDMASELSVKPSSVTEMIKKLRKKGLVEHESYGGAMLTEKGMEIAIGLMEKHRIIADFLEIIGVERKVAEIDACEIEHHISDSSVKRIGKFVDFVRSAPGSPRWVSNFRDYVRTGKVTNCPKRRGLNGP